MHITTKVNFFKRILKSLARNLVVWQPWRKNQPKRSFTKEGSFGRRAV